MADKMSKIVLPIKNPSTGAIVNKEFEFGGSDNLGTAAYKDVPSSGNASSSQVVMGNDSRLNDSRNAKDVSAWAKASTKPTYTASEVGAIATSAKGAANGVAELDSNGKVPSSQLPSYVDDVLEYDSQSAFPSTGETGKIYVAKDTNKSYRWTGSAYSQIKGDLALGETSSTAYRGDRGKTAYDHSQSTHARTDATKTEASSTNGNIKINGTETTVYTHPGSGTNPHGTTKSDVGLGNVPNVTTDNQTPSFTEASTRANIATGEKLSVILGKIKKYFTDLKTVAFSGSYNDLSDKPTIPTNTDSKVSQTATTTSADYEVLFSSTADNTTRTEGARKNSNLKFNPSTGNLQATKLNGVNIGDNPKFTDTNTKNTAGSTDTSSKIFLIGATSQAANPRTYSHDTAYVGTDGCLYSDGKKTLTALPSHNHDDRYFTKLAPIQLTLVADKAYSVGEQFIYNGLLYSVTAAIASGGTITINGNCKLADNVTNQILLLTAELNKLKNATRRTRRNITTDLANLPTAVAEQDLEKYGYTIGDYFIGNSGYTYFLADMNTFRGANNVLAVINQNHISIVVNTGANSKWNNTDDTSTGYSRSVLHSYLSGTVLNNIKSDMIALFGGSTGLEHLLSHQLNWTMATSVWGWSATAQYISALTEPQVYGTNIWAIDGYQTGEAWKHLELFKKFSYMEVLGWIWFWLRSIHSASYACHANNVGDAYYDAASSSNGVVGLIVFK